MKILMTIDAVGGVWQYALALTKGLLNEQIEVVLVCTGPKPSASQIEEIKKLQKNGVGFYHKPYRLEWMDDPWEEVYQANEWIKEIYEAERPTLLHFNNYAPACLDWDVPTLLVAHSCVASWWQAVKHEPLPSEYEIYFQTVQQAFQKADSIVFPSKGLLDLCSGIYGNIADSKVVYNGIILPMTDPLYEFNSKMPVVFSMGRLWDEAKNIDLLLKAAPYINGEIFIAGPKSMDFDCPRNVRFLGKLSHQQVMNWLKISAVYALPVRYEPFGLSFLEAASHQCALVGGDTPTLREIWGKSMTYVDPDDTKGLAKASNHLLENPPESRKKGEEAYQSAKKYPLSKMKEQYLEVYRRLTGSIPRTVPVG